MLPYLEEYLNSKNEYDKKIYSTRLQRFAQHDKSIFDMTAEDLEEIFTFSLITNANLKSCVKTYLKWVKNEYNLDTTEIFYCLDKFVVSDFNYSNLLFDSLEELLAELDEVEDEVMTEYELTELSEKKIDTKYTNFLKLRVYYIFLWYGLEEKDIISVYKYNVDTNLVFVPSLGKSININPDEFYYVSKLQELEAPKNKSQNLFQTDSVSSLTDLSFKAIGKVEDKRFNTKNVKKAGLYYRMNQWEQRYGAIKVSDFDIMSELCHTMKESQMGIKISEYHKYMSTK